MIPNEVKKRILSHELSCAIHSMTVTQWRRLVYKMQPAGMITDNISIGDFIARAYDDTDFFYAAPQRFFYHDLQNRFLSTITINECLQRKGSLPFASSCNYGF